MKQTLLQEKYPVFTLEVSKQETCFRDVDEILAHFKACVDGHESAVYITTFDHLAHTRSLPNGEVAEDIVDAKNIVFCLGIKLPNPQVMAVRPRSIGVCETRDGFVISFMEAPMPVANNAMEAWARAVRET